MVKNLIAGGADPNKADADGSTALHLAAMKGFKDIAQSLISGGADPMRKDKAGNTPPDVAAMRGHWA